MDHSGFASLAEMNATVSAAEEERQANTSFALQQWRQFGAKMCSTVALACKKANSIYDNSYGKIRKLTAGTGNEAHHVFQDAVMARLYEEYKRQLGFAIPLLGGARSRGSPHDVATAVQRKLKGKDAIYVAYASLLGAGCRASDATEIVLAAKRYNEVMGWM